jgi:hypothetical protein
MAKGKKGQNRQTVISNTAQWPNEKKDKMTNSDQQYSTMTKGKKGQNDKQWSQNVTLIIS